MKTPYPFEPPWEAKIGALIRRGKGVLESVLWGVADFIDEFSVVLPDGKITALPKVGMIVSKGTILADCGGIAKLRWFRRMEAVISTHDSNETMAPECLFYELGLKNDKKDIAFRVMPDLRLCPRP